MEEGKIRFFNCYKSVESDRMIGDHRIRNWQEGRRPGVSRALPGAPSLAVLETSPMSQRFSICISDRKDFYHQFALSQPRAYSNELWPPLRKADLHGVASFEKFEKQGRTKYDRRLHGDFLDGGRQKRSVEKDKDELVQACFASIPQGDHLGVELATDSHRCFLKSHGLLGDLQELRADEPFGGEDVVEGLLMTITRSLLRSSVKRGLPPGATVAGSSSEACKLMSRAASAYAEAGILGSADKDVWDADRAKVTGGELDSSLATRRLGLALLSAPVKKRLALSHVSLELASLRWTSDALHACLLGAWTHVMMYRRQFMSLLSSAYKLAPMDEVYKDDPKLCSLSRVGAQEFVMLAVLAPFMVSDLAAVMDSVIYASDASEAKGAFASCQVTKNVARALWGTGRKRTSYVRLLRNKEALCESWMLTSRSMSLTWRIGMGLCLNLRGHEHIVSTS